MEERKSLFDTIKEVCDENDCLRKENNQLRKEINCDAYVRKLLVERNKLREEIDNKEETIQSLIDEYNARGEYNKRLLAEIKLMVKDHEAECVDYRTMISEQVNIDDLHIILAKYLTDNNTTEPVKICFFQFLDEIKKFIDSNKKEC